MENIRTQENSRDTKEFIEKESKKILKVVLNKLIKLNGKELKKKGFLDLSDKAILNKLNKIFLELENSKNIDSKFKIALKAFKDNFLQNDDIIGFLKRKLILKEDIKPDENNIDEYFSIIKKGVLTMQDIGKTSDKKDIDFYMDFISKFGVNNEIFQKFPDLQIIIGDILPSLSKVLDKNSLSSALDLLFNQSKQDILKILKNENLSKDEVYRIKLDFIHNLSGLLNNINNEKVSAILFEKLPSLSFIKQNSSINSIFSILNNSNLQNKDKLEITTYVFDAIGNLSDVNLTEKELNNFSKKTIDFLNSISNKIPEKDFKLLLGKLLNLTKGENEIDLDSLLSYIKKLDYGELFELIKSNFDKIVDIAKKLIDKGITKISLEDFLLEVFKSNILNDISKDLGYKIVEQIKKIASVDIKEMIVQGRKELLGGDFSFKGQINKRIDTNFDNNKLVSSFVDGLMLKFQHQLKYEVLNGDEKITKKEIIALLKSEILELVNNKPKLFIDFMKNLGYKLDNKDAEFVRKFIKKIIENPKFEDIASVFLDNFTDITLAKKDIINSFKEIIKEVKQESREIIFSDRVTTDIKGILLDMIYSPSFNEKNLGNVVSILNKNNIKIPGLNTEKLGEILVLLPKYIKKEDLSLAIKDIDFKNINNTDFYSFTLSLYKKVDNKTLFLNDLLDKGVLSLSKGKSQKLDTKKIDFITELLYETINHSNEVELSELTEKLYDKVGLGKLNEIKIFGQNIAYLTIDFVQATSKENFKKLLRYLDKNVLGKKNLDEKDYIRLGEELLKLVDRKDFIQQLNRETRQNSTDRFLLRNFEKFYFIYNSQKDKIFYLKDKKGDFTSVLNRGNYKTESEKKLLLNYSGDIFDVLHSFIEKFNKKDFRKILSIFMKDNKEIAGLKIGKSKNTLTKEANERLKNSFVGNNILFSIGTFFKYVGNGFKINDYDVMYDYFSDNSNRIDFQDTILGAVHKKTKKRKKSPLDILKPKDRFFHS